MAWYAHPPTPNNGAECVCARACVSVIATSCPLRGGGCAAHPPRDTWARGAWRCALQALRCPGVEDVFEGSCEEEA